MQFHDAWSKIGNNRLPPDWLYTHVYNIAIPMHCIMKITNGNPYCDVPGIKNSGKCQQAHITPKIKLEKIGFSLFWSLGKTKPLHPNSSPSGPPKIIINKKFNKIVTGLLILLGIL